MGSRNQSIFDVDGNWTPDLLYNYQILFVLFNRYIIVNLYQLYFPLSYFSSQPNKWVFYFSTFPSFQSITNERKLNFFYLPTFLSLPHFLSSHFFTSPTYRTLNELRDSFFLAWHQFGGTSNPIKILSWNPCYCSSLLIHQLTSCSECLRTLKDGLLFIS